jgi:hypothetical protein
VYDWRQDTQFMAWFNLPAGETGCEYGGIPVPPPAPFPGATVAPGRSLYLRVAYYFQPNGFELFGGRNLYG